MAAAKTTSVKEATEQVQQGLDMVRDYTKQYNEFMLETTQTAMNQAFAVREAWSDLAGKNVKQVQALASKEQELFVDSVEVYASQAQATYERMSKLFVPAVK